MTLKSPCSKILFYYSWKAIVGSLTIQYMAFEAVICICTFAVLDLSQVS
jgi:hypothetical protein